MSRDCLIDRCGKAALAGQPLCIKHSVMTPQGLREDLHRSWSARFTVQLRLHDGKCVLPEEAAATEFRVRRMEAAVRAYWLVDAGELAAPAAANAKVAA